MIGLFLCLLWILWPVVVTTQAQEIIYHEEPRRVWTEVFNAVGQGNGVYLTPTRDKLVAVSSVGTIKAFSTSGSVLWIFSPPLIDGRRTSCQSGIIFAEDASSSTYLAYMVMDTVAGQTTT